MRARRRPHESATGNPERRLVLLADCHHAWPKIISVESHPPGRSAGVRTAPKLILMTG